MLHGVLDVLRTGCAWADLPRPDPPRSNGHDRLPRRIKSGVFEAVLDDVAEDLQTAGLLDWRECFIDGSFAPAKRGSAGVGQTKEGPRQQAQGRGGSPGRADRPHHRQR